MVAVASNVFRMQHIQMWGRVCMWLTYSNLFCCTLTWGITSKQIKLCNIIIYPKNRVQFWDPKTSFYFAIWPAFPLRLVHPVLRPWILSKPPLSLQHSDILNLSTSVSPLALLLPENFKRRQKKKWDQLQLNTPAQIYSTFLM